MRQKIPFIVLLGLSCVLCSPLARVRADEAEPKATEAEPKTAKEFVIRADAEQDIDPDKAITDYTKAIEMEPEFIYAYDRRAQVYSQKKNWSAAISDYTKELELTIQLKAEDRAYDERYDDSKESMRRVGAPGIYLERGGVRAMNKEYQDAIEDYTAAIALFRYDSAKYVPLVLRGDAKAGSGDLDGAIADYNQAMPLSPKLPLALLHRADVLREKQDYDAALADLAKAIEMKPRSTQGYMFRARVFEDKGDWNGAIADYTSAIERAPKYAEFYLSRGLAYHQNGEEEKAKADFDKAIELKPELKAQIEEKLKPAPPK